MDPAPRSRGFVSSSSLSREIFGIPGRGGGPGCGRSFASGAPVGGVSGAGGRDGGVFFGGIEIEPGGRDGGFGGIETTGGRDDVFGD